MSILIFDLESDGYLDQLTKVWTIQLGEADGDDVTVYADQPGFPPLSDAIARMGAVERIVGHNAIGFDAHVIERFWPGTIPRERYWDTLVAARLKHPDEKDHQLDTWGRRLKLLKGKYKGDFQTFDEELVTYAAQDIRVTRALYHRVRDVDQWGESCQLEHDVAWIINSQERRGCMLDREHAQRLDAKLRGQLAELTVALQAEFPPIQHEQVWIPQASNSKYGYVKGQPFTKRWTEVFNPASRHHVGRRLVALGWDPALMTQDGHPVVDEKTLAPLAARFPQAKTLLEYVKIAKRLGQLSDGKTGWLKLVKPSGRVHGRVNPNGAVTGRMAHSGPNLANVDKDPDMRACWIPAPGLDMVGCDAEGLEARMLAHYLGKYDGGSFRDRLLSGTKEARTDVHSANLKGLVDARLLPRWAWDDLKGFKVGRDGAKTGLYAKIYGARHRKLGTTLKEIWRDLERAFGGPLGQPKVPVVELGKLVDAAFARTMVGIDKLVEAIIAAKREKGYLIGLDGRRLFIRSEHSALNTLLQGGGAIVMKKALVLFVRRHRDTFEKRWWFVLNVHDEVQMEAEPEIAEMLGRDFADCIREAGELLKCRCPLAGSYDVGKNWSQTH